MDRIALCAIFKNEAPFLLEWIAYHRMLGVDHFVLYDNVSDDGGAAILRESAFSRYVTVIDWPDRPGQFSAYRDFIQAYASTYTWAGFIDMDEFIHPLGGNSLRNALRDPRYDGFSAVLLHWLMFGPSGHRARPADPVIASYQQRLPDADPANRHVKSLVRTKDLLDVGSTPHIFPTTGPCCDALGRRVPAHAIQDDACLEGIVLNHYYTRSREDWEAKLRRGRADTPDDAAVQYHMGMFDTLASTAIEPDARITRFVPRLQWLMR